MENEIKGQKQQIIVQLLNQKIASFAPGSLKYTVTIYCIWYF